MHGQLIAYERDTEVVDEPIAIGRAPSEDLVVQVWLFQQWHRRMADIDETACGIPFKPTERTRREQLTRREGDLCSGDCFTLRELRRATENDRRLDEEVANRKRRDTIDSLFKSLPCPPDGEGDE